MYIHQPCAQRAHIHPTTDINSNCWQYKPNTNNYIQLTYISQIVGSIYPVKIYMLGNAHFSNLHTKGAQTPPNWH